MGFSLARKPEPDDSRGQRTPLLKGDLDRIVMKCLEKDRSRRYETANGLAADLKRYLSHQPVTAGPPSAIYALRKFACATGGR